MTAAVVTIAVSVITTIIGIVGAVTVSYINTHKSTIKHNNLITLGTEAWFEVDEFFRLHPETKKTVDTTLDAFFNAIAKKNLKLSDDEIITLRDTIAGQVNSVKDALNK